MVYRPSITSVPESLSTVENPFAVHSILAFSKGIICSAGLGTVHLFDKTEDKEMYKKTKEICIPADSQSADPEASRNQVINCLSLSPSEETLVSSTVDNQLYSITLSSADLGKVFVYLTLFTIICISLITFLFLRAQASLSLVNSNHRPCLFNRLELAD